VASNPGTPQNVSVMAAANVRDGLNADVHATSQLPSVTLDDNTRKSITVASIMASKVKLNVQSFPRPPALQKISRDIRITFRGDTIAQTQDAYWVLETHHPPSGFPVMTPISFGRASLSLQPLMGTAYYLPRTSVKLALTPTGRRTGCEWKGTATYYEAKLGDGTTDDWTAFKTAIEAMTSPQEADSTAPYGRTLLVPRRRRLSRSAATCPSTPARLGIASLMAKGLSRSRETFTAAGSRPISRGSSRATPVTLTRSFREGRRLASPFDESCCGMRSP